MFTDLLNVKIYSNSLPTQRSIASATSSGLPLSVDVPDTTRGGRVRLLAWLPVRSLMEAPLGSVIALEVMFAKWAPDLLDVITC